MKRRLTSVFLSLLVVLGLGGLSSCSSDNNYDNYDEIQHMIDQSLNGQWTIVNIKINKADWNWVLEDKNKPEMGGHYEATAQLPELTENIYKEGAVLGYIILPNNVQKPLPWINTYSTIVNNQNITFSETISYDVQFVAGKQSNVLFTIKDSDLANDQNAPQDYNFKIVLIW